MSSEIGNELISIGEVTIPFIEYPREDFEINVVGTFNLLESSRQLSHKPVIFYSSTNKVYGSLEHLQIKTTDS